jgi:hypothetical protein
MTQPTILHKSRPCGEYNAFWLRLSEAKPRQALCGFIFLENRDRRIILPGLAKILIINHR